MCVYVCVAYFNNSQSLGREGGSRRQSRWGVVEGNEWRGATVSLETPAKTGNNGCMVIPMTVTHAYSRNIWPIIAR